MKGYWVRTGEYRYPWWMDKLLAYDLNKYRWLGFFAPIFVGVKHGFLYSGVVKDRPVYRWINRE